MIPYLENDRMRLKKGILIVLEGIDGAGKSTQARLLLRTLRSLGFAAVYFREPTRGKWGREIKKLAKRSSSLTPEEELDLFIRDRKENIRTNLRPALRQRKAVILDRYYFSSIAYQGAKGISPALIKRENEKFAVRPDLVFILDIRAGEGLDRIHHRKKKDLLFERERYLARVRRIFQGFQGRKFIHLDATLPRAETAAAIASRVLHLLHRHTA